MADEIVFHWYLIAADTGMMPTAQFEIVTRKVGWLLPKMWRRALVDGQFRPVSSLRLPGNFGFVELPKIKGDPLETLLNEKAAAVEALRGVRKVYTNAAGRYSRVPADEIQYLKDQEAADYKEACKSKPKFAAPKFPPNTTVRILRNERYAGYVGEYLYSLRGMATIAMPNGIKLPPIPDCDIVQITKGEAVRLAG